ncbi:HNH endonuclease signature motif containing protein [Microbacterium kribbense]
MNEAIGTLDGIREQLAVLVSSAFDSGAMHHSAEAELLEALRAAGDLQRLVDAVLVEGVAEIAERSRQRDRSERLSTRMGCHNVNELVQRVTRCSPQAAGRLELAQRAVGVDWDPIDGEAMPARLPAIRVALRDGEVGVDGVVAVAKPMLGMRDRVERTKVLAADAAIAAFARGAGPDGEPPAWADLLAVQAMVWACALDPDGDEPRDRDAGLDRFFTMGKARPNGITPFRGGATPEVAAQLQRIMDASISPHVQGVQFAESDGGGVGSDEDDGAWVDQRTRSQKQHDALASALFAAAASGELPTIGGAAPTVIVTAYAADLARGSGWAFLEGTAEPISMAAATHLACAGAIQRVVLNEDGRIVQLGNLERVFNAHQRRAITLRDGGCIIPGCGIPAGWCEIHHVQEHARGGPTHTDNGVLLCWGHHRFIDTGPWQIRMREGVPEIRGPAWFDPAQRWRRVTKSKTRLLRLLQPA